MGEWRGPRWLTIHAIIAPFGVFTVTVGLVYLSGRWTGWGSLNDAAEMVDLAAVLYAMSAVLSERGINMIVWALEQRRKRREAFKAQVETSTLAALRREARAEENQELEERLERFAREKGITLEELPPQ